MIHQKYLRGIRLDPVDDTWPRELKAKSIVKSGKMCTRYICTYSDGKKYKSYLFDLLRKHGQPESRGTWDLHHIVEGQHYADIDFLGQIDTYYKNRLPCVFLANEEHHMINSLLHCKQSNELWRNYFLPRDVIKRSKDTMQDAQNQDKHMQLKKRIDKISNLYRNAYVGRPVLQKVAENIINEAKYILRTLS